MSQAASPIYLIVRSAIRLALAFYFRHMERFHADRVPLTGPVLFTSNHPNSLTDSFVLSASLTRPIHFIATVQLFRLSPVRWLLSQCGVIPINRVADDPKGMRSVADTFEACFRVLERSETIGIFPEGITYDDSQLKEVKSGAARMALELEHRHNGTLGLRVVPVGLTYSAKEKYRSNVLIHYGEPIKASDFLKDYATQRKDCIRRLTSEIETRLRSLILNTPELEVDRLVTAVKSLYLDRLLLANTVILEPTPHEAQELLLSQAIADVVRHVQRSQPDQAAAFAAKLNRYESWRDRLQLSEAALASLPQKGRLFLRTAFSALLALVGAPVAFYGWVHRLIPWAIIRWAERRFIQGTKRKAQRSTAAIAAGVVAFGLFYAACIIVFFALFGWPAVLYYALSLPIASLQAHYYAVHLKQLWGSVHDLWVLTRAPFASRRLLAVRSELITEIERVRHELRPTPIPKPAQT